MVTDNSSNITQGMLYAPFGEIICDYNPTFHDSPMPNYAFNAKELDEENNMYYYSARYYAPPTFISRDPMFEKYPSISPYTYCMNNPVAFIDPNGKIPWYALVSGYNRSNKPNPPTSARVHPVLGNIRPHHGMDMPAKTGTSVNAAATGKVVFAGTKKGYGNTVVIDHGGGIYSLYAHLNDINVENGAEISNGSNIGEVGNTGVRTGSHLHVEYIKTDNIKNIFGKNKNSSRFNPMDIEDLQDIIDNKERKDVQFLDGHTETVGGYQQKTSSIGPAPDPKLSEKIQGFKSPVTSLIGKVLESLGF
jgi:RHS repeat-associated protein